MVQLDHIAQRNRAHLVRYTGNIICIAAFRYLDVFPRTFSILLRSFPLLILIIFEESFLLVPLATPFDACTAQSRYISIYLFNLSDEVVCKLRIEITFPFAQIV